MTDILTRIFVKDYKNLNPQYNTVRPVEDLVTDVIEEDEEDII